MPTSSTLRARPARLTAPAATKLPRWVIFSLCLLYIMAGLFLRDPWKTDDAIGLAQMWSAVHLGGQAWLLPQVAGVAASINGPLPTWVGGFSLQVFGPLIGDIAAGRLPNLLWFGLTTASLWYGVYLLGRRPEVQPLELPFGGQPPASDYGRLLADAALLLLIATLGLAWSSHETSVVPAALAFQALAFYSLARMLDRPWSGCLTLAIALAAAFLSRGFAALLPFLIALPWLVAGPLRRPWHLLAAVVLASGLVMLWLVPAYEASPYWVLGWWQWHLDYFDGLHLRGLQSLLRNGPWFLWPLWPLAALALWRWRGWINTPALHLPAALLAGAAVQLLLAGQPDEPELLAMVIPGALLAALALPTLRRGQINTLDWFAVMAFSVAAALIWFGWNTALTGWPTQIAANIERQTPGLTLQVQWGMTLAALAVTIGWIVLVVWRIQRQPPALWRGVVMSAGGVLTAWLLLIGLWLPSIDYARSYRPVSGAIAATLALEQRAGECVRTRGLGLAQRASLAVIDGLVFTFDGRCTLVLEQTSRDGMTPLPAGTTLLWEGARPADRHEHYRLYRAAP